MDTTITRRSFVKWGAAAASMAGLSGLAATSQAYAEDDPSPAAVPEETGVWKTAACADNCNCGSSRCLLRVYMEDGVPLVTRSDETEGDDIYNSQHRACGRGHAQMSDMLSPARIKYPMKRKNWMPGDPHGELRGIDEWERITWDEALDYIADELTRIIDTYGIRGIFTAGYTGGADQVVSLLDVLGGSIHGEMATTSFGSWSVPDSHMIGGWGFNVTAMHQAQALNSDLHVLFGANWAANKAGNHSWALNQARANGAKVIHIDPWLHQTAQGACDEWIPVLPGSDVALVMAITYQWIVNGTYDQEYLDKYTIGFDAEHMPEGEPVEENYKDYILGTYTGEPRDPAWAETICGVPAEQIIALADEIAAVDKVNFFAGQSTSKFPAGEQFVQAFYTMALMHGGIGSKGHYMGWGGFKGSNTAAVAAGNAYGTDVNPPNPLMPAGAPIYMVYSIPMFDIMEDPTAAAWECLEESETWKSIDQGFHGRDIWPGGVHPLDIHCIYYGGRENVLNSFPNTNLGIKVTRDMEFVFGTNPWFDTSRQYCDIVLPTSSKWEWMDIAYNQLTDSIFYTEQILPPSFESKMETWITDELSRRMGVDPTLANPLPDPERQYRSFRDATYTDEAGNTMPFLTISQEDIDAMGAEGEPQEGLITMAEFKESGIFRVPTTADTVFAEPFGAFYEDPEANPLDTESGKFEIYSRTLAARVNAVGFDTISPIAKFQIADPEQGPGTQTEEWPLLLWSPHSLRRAHTIHDNVISLREAFPQECFMSTIDAEARGIKNGDIVLMSSPYGQCLRPAKVLPTIVPGAVALQDGGWTQIDPETGIDLGGNPNILQAPRSSGSGSQSWTGTLCQVEKYEGPLTLLPDKDRPIVMPVGIEE